MPAPVAAPAVPLVVRLLQIFAAAAGAKLGEETVKLVSKLFDNLATKEDLKKAVEEIKSYIDQAVEQLKAADVYVNINTGIDQYRIWELKPSDQLLLDVRELTRKAVHGYDDMVKQNKNVKRLYFVTLTNIVAADAAVGMAIVKYVKLATKSLIAGEAGEHAERLIAAKEAIEQFQEERLEKVQVGSSNAIDALQSPGDGMGPRIPDDPPQWRAGFYLYGQRYDKGRGEIRGDWHNSQEEAVAQVNLLRAREQKRIDREKAERKVVFDALDATVAALRGLQPAIEAYQSEG